MLSSCVSALLATAPGTRPMKGESLQTRSLVTAGRGLYLLYPPKGLRGSLASHLGTDREGTEVRTATWAGMSTVARGRFW